MKKGPRFTWVLAAASIEAVQGPAVWITDTQGMHHATPGMVIAEGARVRTEGQSAVEVRLAGGSRLALARSSEARFFTSFDHVTYLELSSGGLLASLRTSAGDLQRPQGQRTPSFVVRAPGFALGLGAADFDVTLDRSGGGTLHVLQGAVNVADDERTIVSGGGGILAAGQELEISAGRYGESESFSPNSHLKELSHDQPELAALVTSDAAFFGAPLVVASGSGSGSDNPEDLGPRLRLARFQVTSMDLVSLSGSSTQTPSVELSWNPSLRIWKPLHFRLQLGAFPYLNSGATVGILEGAGLLALKLGRFSLEVGGGMQAWLAPISQNAPVVMGDLGYEIQPAGWFERIFVGFAEFMSSGAAVAEARLGVGIRF